MDRNRKEKVTMLDHGVNTEVYVQYNSVMSESCKSSI